MSHTQIILATDVAQWNMVGVVKSVYFLKYDRHLDEVSSCELIFLLYNVLYSLSVYSCHIHLAIVLESWIFNSHM